MSSDEKLYHLTSNTFRLSYGIDRNSHVLSVKADNIPLLCWPDGRPCTEANLYLLYCFERGLSRKEDGGTLTQYAKLLSHLIRFCFKNNYSFIDLTDSRFSLFIRMLQGEMDTRKPGQRKRQAAHVANIGRTCLGFLGYVGELYLEPSFIGATGTIRAETKEVKLTNLGNQITRTYWHHHSFPHPEPQTRRLPINSKNIAKLIEVIPDVSTTTYQRRRRFILVKLLEITGARRIEVANIRVEDIYNARMMKPEPVLKVFTAKRSGGKEEYRYLPISRTDLELIVNFIEKFRHRVIKKTVGANGDLGYLLISETSGLRLATETLTNELLLLAKAAKIEEQACAHMFRHRFITKLFVALLEQHEYDNGDDFRRALLDGETLKRKVQEYTGHTSISSLEPYIHLAFEEVANFGTTLDLIKARLVIESLQSNLKDVVFELSQGRNPAELSLLLSNYVNVALEELSSTSIAIER
ncbi:TPA: site-specific integrase [Yersinia enterocolitica]|uniref:tyrosine-type recombinase/integrase n=1 Tax=Yersinia enterocolitica TaxID=630 RepID=UPI001643A0CD|nr:site-specific integrase [Yersinia enterocolitica]HDL6777755.1 site-specific integrase [Yersinia enterocolitica]HDM8312458.1 site-specific integrase [Yersinia enterocolitica]HDV7144134.1 site-specific integrase [Yersinia enterocolitica]HDV7153574.1 site-specific integrase [Yersinia enterocolitica]